MTGRCPTLRAGKVFFVGHRAADRGPGAGEHIFSCSSRTADALERPAVSAARPTPQHQAPAPPLQKEGCISPPGGPPRVIPGMHPALCQSKPRSPSTRTPRQASVFLAAHLYVCLGVTKGGQARMTQSPAAVPPPALGTDEGGVLRRQSRDR